MYILISIFTAYAIGIISYEYGYFSYLCTALIVLLIYNSYTSKKVIYNLVIIAFLVLSFINYNYNSKFVLTQYVNEEVEIVAKIIKQNKSKKDSYYDSYNASLISINDTTLNEEENTIIYVEKNDYVQENSIVLFTGRVADSKLSENKMLFNYSNYLRSKKIGSIIFVEGYVKQLKQDYSFLNDVSSKFRNYAENTFFDSLNYENADVILSVILGDVDYLDESFYDNIKLMGLAHIFAVSGSHIVLMYGFLLSVLKFCGLSHTISWVVTWVIIWIYGFLIGFPLSVMRTLVMFTLLFGAELFYRKYNSLNSIGLAALILTVYNPFWLFDAGFLLSFSAALSIIVYNKYIVKNLLTDNIILKTTYLYLFLQLFTLPVIAYYFNYVPLMGILYNLLLLPMFTVILIYGFILLILNGFFSFLLLIPFKIFDYILYSLRYIINFTEEFTFNGIIVPSMSVGLIIFFYTMLVYMIYLYNNKKSCTKRYGAAALLSFYTINFIILPITDINLYFNVADAGQGLFTTVKYKNTNLIIDCGSSSSNAFGEYTVVPYITKYGVTNIDGIFISHWDEDHYSGLRELINSHINVRKIFSSSNNNELKYVNILTRESKLSLDDHLIIEVLWPNENYVADNTNNISLVILLRFNNSSILMTGDIEEEVESIILNDIEHSDILIVPHHGSSTSSTMSFVEKTSPEIAVISYGKNNYGIPSEEVISRYKKEKSLILSTFTEGEINFILKGDKIYYNTYTGEKSSNYYELYFAEIISNFMNFCFLLIWIVKNKGEHYELQNNNRDDWKNESTKLFDSLWYWGILHRQCCKCT